MSGRSTRKTDARGPNRDPVRSIDLVFTHTDRLRHVDDEIGEDISSLAIKGRSIFCTCDETSTIERVLLDDETMEAGEHVNYLLGDIFDLPDGPGGEMDIEGLSIDDGYLWVCGSHSLKRGLPSGEDLGDLAKTEWDANRAFLGRVPLLDRGDGVFEPVAAIEQIGDGGGHAACMIPMTSSRKTPIRRMLAKDPHIGPFVDLPCKENGLDIEGVAVRGDTVLLGLRGPVVGGFALLVGMEMKETKDGTLRPRKLESGSRYALQALDLNGQGIRDLLWHDDQLFVLSGATTDLEALQSVCVIDDYQPDRKLYPAGALRREIDLPIHRDADHAEGISVLENGLGPALVIAYDTPHNDRRVEQEQRLTVDLFGL